MVARRTYNCDLCRSSMTQETGTGIYFDGNGIVRRRVKDCETHLCNVCLQALKSFIEVENMEPL